MTDAKDILRSDRSALVSALREAGADIHNERSFKCCFHEDRTPSAGIYEAEPGVWKVKCQAASCGFCGDVFDVRAKATGKSVEDQLRELREGEKPKRKTVSSWPSVKAWEASIDGLVRTYCYTNPDTGRIDLLKCRIEVGGQKTFRQARIGTDGRVYGEAPPYPHPLYNRTRVRASESVIVVEGEKCVEAIHDAGMVATCCPGGGSHGKAALADWKPLAGKTVYLWPDHDPADDNGLRGGHQHMREVAEILSHLTPPPSLWWIDPEKLNLGDKQDAFDFLARFEGGKLDALSDALDLAIPMDGASELATLLADMKSGAWANEPLASMPVLSKLAKPLMPGCSVFLVGDPGSTKSILAMQIESDLALVSNVKSVAYMLEDDRRFHMLRALAQMSGHSWLTDDDEVRARPDEVDRLFAEHRKQCAALARHIYDAPSSTIGFKQVLVWMERVCSEGARVLIIDPVTAIDFGEKASWNAERDFMASAKAVLRKYRASLLMVTHPRNANNKRTVDDLAGSRAFGRFAQCVLWMRTHDKPKAVEVSRRLCDGSLDRSQASIDRELIIVKARNGRGQGARVGLQFDKRSITFRELGQITRELKRDEDDQAGE